mmetsp:Transcript_54607/g.63041  ORF Transcript_54607/g.63041 Transcript_54607/m.63041 type:complete len:351 (+) Transcript_54607:2-1054(+)
MIIMHLSFFLSVLFCIFFVFDRCYAFTSVVVAQSRRPAVSVRQSDQSSVKTSVVLSSSNKDENPIAENPSRPSSDTSISNDNNATNKIPQQQNEEQTKQSPNTLSVQDLMLAMGTNPRRIFLSVVSATGIALTGNFLGITSRLLMAIPEDKVEATGIDTYFPRGDFKRCQTDEYTFVLPSEWVADTYLALAKAKRKTQPLDYSMQEQKSVTLPDSAYGPPGRLNEQGFSQQGDTNVSVIVSSGLSGFSLKSIGTPTDAAEILLSRSIAPEGSGRTAKLLRSIEDRDSETYQFEYIVDRNRGPQLRNIAVIAASPKGDTLYTLTVVAPAEKWIDDKYDAKLRKIADSFHLR